MPAAPSSFASIPPLRSSTPSPSPPRQDATSTAELTCALGEGLVGRAALERRVIWTGNALEDRQAGAYWKAHASLLGEGRRAAMAAPLICRRRAVRRAPDRLRRDADVPCQRDLRVRQARVVRRDGPGERPPARHHRARRPPASAAPRRRRPPDRRRRAGRDRPQASSPPPATWSRPEPAGSGCATARAAVAACRPHRAGRAGCPADRLRAGRARGCAGSPRVRHRLSRPPTTVQPAGAPAGWRPRAVEGASAWLRGVRCVPLSRAAWWTACWCWTASRPPGTWTTRTSSGRWPRRRPSR